MEWWQGRALKTIWIAAALTAVAIMILAISLAPGDAATTVTGTPNVVQPRPETPIASIATPAATPITTPTPFALSTATTAVTPSPSLATPTATPATPSSATPAPATPMPKATSPATEVAERTTPSGSTSAPATTSGANAAASSGEPPAQTGFAGGIIPVRLLINTASMQVDADVEKLGLTPDRLMEAPAGWWDVGWYKLGYQPGQQGNAVIAGHLDSYTGPAVFWNLKDLHPGDIVTVVGTQGEQLRFRVSGLQTFDDASAPIAAIFGPSDGRHLNLITCDGVWDSSTGAYTKRLVVFTDLVGS